MLDETISTFGAFILTFRSWVLLSVTFSYSNI